MRWNHGALALLALLLLPVVANAKKTKTTTITGGTVTFPHAPVNPEDPDGFCPDGLLFSVTSSGIEAVIKTKKNNQERETVFPSGVGEASGCVFVPPPMEGPVAVFTGSFALERPGGVLTGTIELFDFPLVVDGVVVEGVFVVVADLTFDGGTGRFNHVTGHATATGLDFPFGGLDEDPLLGGVSLQIQEGQLTKH